MRSWNTGMISNRISVYWWRSLCHKDTRCPLEHTGFSTAIIRKLHDGSINPVRCIILQSFPGVPSTRSTSEKRNTGAVVGVISAPSSTPATVKTVRSYHLLGLDESLPDDNPPPAMSFRNVLAQFETWFINGSTTSWTLKCLWSIGKMRRT